MIRICQDEETQRWTRVPSPYLRPCRDGLDFPPRARELQCRWRRKVHDQDSRVARQVDDVTTADGPTATTALPDRQPSLAAAPGSLAV